MYVANLWVVLLCYFLGLGASVIVLLLRKQIEPGLFKFFNKRLLERVDGLLLPGSIIELVLYSSPVTVWKRLLFYVLRNMTAYLIVGFSVFSMLRSVVEIFAGPSFSLVTYLALYAIIVLIGILPAWQYFVFEWERLHSKLVVTTTWVWYASAKFILLGLVFPQADISGSDGTAEQLKETRIESDRERIKKDVKTGWFEDFLTRWMYKSRRVASLLLASNYFGAGDVLSEFDNADWLKNVLKIIQTLSARVHTRFAIYYKTLAEAEIGKVGGSEDEGHKKFEQVATFAAKHSAMDLARGVTTFDLWAAEDPGRWKYPLLTPQRNGHSFSPTDASGLQGVVLPQGSNGTEVVTVPD